MKRILFFKFGALGDVLMTTPLLRQTRRAFPSAQIHYYVAEPFALAVKENPFVDDVIAFDPAIFTKRELGDWVLLTGKLRSAEYDLAFVLDKHFVFALTTWLARIPRRIGFHRDFLARLFLTQSVPYGGTRHDIHCNLDLLGRVAPCDYSDTQLDFATSESWERISARFVRLAKPYFVCVNSGGTNIRESTGIRKLPRDLFLELLVKLSERNVTVLLGDKYDREYYASLPLPDSVLNLAGGTTIGECATIMADAEKIFTTDCGLMHLAATTKTPIRAFFGPTHPKRTGPLTPRAEIVWKDQANYDPEYRTRGRAPRNAYFRTFNGSDLLDVNSAGEVALPCMPTHE